MLIAISVRKRVSLEDLINVVQAENGQEWMVVEFPNCRNPQSCSGFDLTTLWEGDPQIAADDVAVFEFVLRRRFFTPRTILVMANSLSESLEPNDRRRKAACHELIFVVLASFTDEVDLYEQSAS